MPNAGNSAEEFGNFAGLNFDWSGFGERISRQVEQATARAAKRAKKQPAARNDMRTSGTSLEREMQSTGPWNWDFNQRMYPRHLRLLPSLWRTKSGWQS